MSKMSIILILKKRFLIQTVAVLLIIFSTISCFEFYDKNASTVSGLLSSETAPVPLAANGLEPETPQDFDDPPFYDPPVPSKVIPASEVMARGQEIPLDFIYNDLQWKRKAYKEYWHSKYKRWSYVPVRLHYAMHRLFATYPTASIYYDFIHDLGIAEESTKFKDYLPAPPKDKTQKVNPYQKIEVVVMQTEVIKAITYGNQIVIVGKPRQTGLQAFTISVDRLSPFNEDENMLIQLATSEGDVIDSSSIGLVKFNESFHQ